MFVTASLDLPTRENLEGEMLAHDKTEMVLKLQVLDNRGMVYAETDQTYMLMFNERHVKTENAIIEIMKREYVRSPDPEPHDLDSLTRTFMKIGKM